MGILDMLSNLRDIFEVGRKTTTDKKDNKSKKRNFDFEDGEKMPSSRKEYNLGKVNISQKTVSANKNKLRTDKKGKESKDTSERDR